MRLHGPDEPVYTIGVAARLLGVSTQVLRQFDREGLLDVARTDANTRLYSENDMRLLARILYLHRCQGINLAGIKALLEMERAMDRAVDSGGPTAAPKHVKM